MVVRLRFWKNNARMSPNSILAFSYWLGDLTVTLSK